MLRGFPSRKWGLDKRWKVRLWKIGGEGVGGCGKRGVVESESKATSCLGEPKELRECDARNLVSKCRQRDGSVSHT